MHLTSTSLSPESINIYFMAQIREIDLIGGNIKIFSVIQGSHTLFKQPQAFAFGNVFTLSENPCILYTIFR